MRRNCLSIILWMVLLLLVVLVGCSKKQIPVPSAPAATTPAVTTAPYYQISFNNVSGQIPPMQVSPGQVATRPADPTRVGYEFTGWTLNGEPYDFSAPVTSHLTLTANWTVRICQVSFVDLEGNELYATTVPYGTEVTPPDYEATDLADNELVEGWSIEGGDPFDGIVRQSGVYTPHKIPAATVYFWDEYGETPLYSIKLRVGEKLNQAPAPLDKSAERKEFVAWVNSSGGTFRPGRGYDESISFYATYCQQFEVRFYCGDTLKQTLMIADGSTVQNPPTPDAAEAGMAFVDWCTDEGERWTNRYTIQQDTVFRAVYKPLRTVTFMLNGQVLETQTVKDGGIATVPTSSKVFYTYSPADALYNVTEDRTVELTAVSFSDYRRYTYGMTSENSQYFRYVQTDGYVAKYATVLYKEGQYFTVTGDMYGPITGWINQNNLSPGMSVEFDVILDGVVVNHVVLTSSYNANAHPIMCTVPTPGEHTLTIRVTAMNGIYEFNQWGSNMLCSVLYCYTPR